MNLFSGFEQYMPHGMCLLWQPWLVILWAGSDLLIFAAYMAIPFALLRVLRRRNDIEDGGLVALFAAFILLCGITHAMSIVTLWVPIYPLQGLVKLATGIVSLVTAVVLFRLVPILVSLPSPMQLQSANEELRKSVKAEKDTAAKLEKVNDQLENRVAIRTVELELARERMATVAGEAVHRSRNLLSVVTRLSRSTGHDDIGDPGMELENMQRRLNAMTVAMSTVLTADGGLVAQFGRLVRRQLEPLFPQSSNAVFMDGDLVELAAEGAQQLGLVIHELATNALKHGRTAGPQPHIHIEWSVERDNDANGRVGAAGADKLVFTWRERLDERAEPMQDGEWAGLGSELLLKVVPKILRGTAERRIADGVMLYTLRVPMSELQPIAMPGGRVQSSNDGAAIHSGEAA